MVKLRAVLVPLALAGMLAITGLILARIYAGGLAPRLLGGAAVGSVLISLTLRRAPSWSAAPASVLGLAGFLVLAVRLSAASGNVAGSVGALTRDALANGVPRLLTAMIPIEPQPDTVVVPVIATWLAGLASAEVAVRSRRVLLSYLPPTLLLAGSLYLVGPNVRPDLWLPLAYAGCAAVGLAASAGARAQSDPELTRQQRGTLRMRVVAGAVAGLAIIGVLAVAVGPSVAARVGQAPDDPRRYIEPPTLSSLDESPLVRISGWALNPDQHLFNADLSGAGTSADTSTRIRLAVLSDYDGITWRVGAKYRSAGRVLTGPAGPTGPAAPAGAAAQEATGPEIEQHITIDELDGRLLPAAAAPERVDGVRVAYDEATGALALPDGLHPGVSYTVVSRRPTYPVNELPAADVPSGEAVSRYLALPGVVPSDIQRLATQLSVGVAAPYQRAQAIAAFLSEHYLLVSDAPSGHAYPNLTFFLFGSHTAGGQRGTSEQFAAAFAVLGRALALPTRVVVGFDAKPGHPAVTGANAIAWPEVLFTGIGWVPFDPLPQPNTAPRPVEDDFKPPPPASAPPPTAAVTPSASAAAAAPPPNRPHDDQRRPVSHGVVVAAELGAGSLGTAVLGALLAVPVLRMRLRRRRLTAGTAHERVAGAWLELLDGLRLAGRPAAGHLAAREVAGYAARAAHGPVHAGAPPRLQLPPPGIDALAGAVNAAAFGPAVAPVSDGDARHAVAQATAYVAELRARRPWLRRVLWTFDPRPLGWARRSVGRVRQTSARTAVSPDGAGLRRPGPGSPR